MCIDKNMFKILHIKTFLKDIKIKNNLKNELPNIKRTEVQKNNRDQGLS